MKFHDAEQALREAKLEREKAEHGSIDGDGKLVEDRDEESADEGAGEDMDGEEEGEEEVDDEDGDDEEGDEGETDAESDESTSSDEPEQECDFGTWLRNLALRLEILNSSTMSLVTPAAVRKPSREDRKELHNTIADSFGRDNQEITELRFERWDAQLLRRRVIHERKEVQDRTDNWQAQPTTEREESRRL
jgi:hypothetical protein